MYRRIAIFVLVIHGACRSLSADCTLPSDFCGQLSSWVFIGAPAHFTGANVALFTPKRVLAVRKNEKGQAERREFCGLLIEWTPYGDVGESDDEKGVLIAMKLVGEVYLFDEGKLVGVERESSVEWADGKPAASGVKVWLERHGSSTRHHRSTSVETSGFQVTSDFRQ